MATVLHNLGNVYNNSGESETARSYLNRSLKLNLEIYGEMHPEVAEGYRNLANMAMDKHAYDTAFVNYHKALEIQLKVFGIKHPDVAVILQSLGKLYLRRGKIDQALDHFQLSIIALVADFNDEKIPANPGLEKVSRDNYLFMSLELKADALASRFESSGNVQDLRVALETYTRAVTLVDKMRSSFQSEGSKLFWSLNAYTLYEKAIRAAIGLSKVSGDKSYLEKAFVFSEKSKTSVLLAALSEIKAKAFCRHPSRTSRRGKPVESRPDSLPLPASR